MKKYSKIKFKFNKLLIFVFTFMCTMMSSSIMVFADNEGGDGGGGLASSKPVQGTVSLLKDVTSALLIIIPVSATAMVMYFLFRKSNADEQDQKKWKDRATNTIICSALAEGLSALMTTILAYYQ